MGINKLKNYYFMENINEELVNAIGREIEDNGLDGLAESLMASFEESEQDGCSVNWHINVLIQSLKEKYPSFKPF